MSAVPTGLRAALLVPVRTAWRRLTSMRTALILLFLLAVAAVPGSLLPQRPLNPAATAKYIAAHGSWGSFLGSIGMYDVFGSVWFAAVYLLLFVSLIGCLIPRIRVHARAMVRAPLPAPRNLARLPESASFAVAAEPGEYARAARSALGRRWRVTRRDEPSGALTLSAEKGYSRETGNLIFHVALLAALILIAIGRLYTYSGSRIVEQGQGFCNSVIQYDAWHPGRLAAEGKVRPAPFCLTDLSRFTATYTASGEPSEFRADVAYRSSIDAPVRRTAISVNHPLRLDGDRVYLIGHGYAPTVTVRMPDGSVRRDTEVFVPTNSSTLYSEGAYKLVGPAGHNEDLGISGFFAPSPVTAADGTVSSSSPKVDRPALGIFVYRGDLSGRGTDQSVYTLDTSTMRQLGTPATLRIGQTQRFPGGVTVTFDGWQPWASFQVSHDPAQGYLLIAAVAMVAGLIGSLGVRRRRLWLRIAPAAVDGAAPGGADDGRSPTVVSVGGLARSDSGNFGTEFAALVERLQAAGTRGALPETVGAADFGGVGADPVGAGRSGGQYVGPRGD